MAKKLEQEQEQDINSNKVQAGNIKEGHIIVDIQGPTVKFIQVCRVGHVKNGKHGAAKIHIDGKDLINRNNINFSVIGAHMFETTKALKREYIVEDIYTEEDTIFLTPNDNSESEPITFSLQDMGDENKRNIISIFEAVSQDLNNNEAKVIIAITHLKQNIVIDSIRTTKKE